MAEEKPSLHIDTDWKKQAQEEKKKLAEQEAQRKAAASAAPVGPAGVVPTSATAPAAAGSAGGRAPAQQGARGRRDVQELPEASLESLIQSIVTQILYYIGDIATRGGEGMLNLDMAKHNIDVLNLLEEKTKGNLTPDEQQMLDAALYEVRMRYVSVASRYIDLP